MLWASESAAQSKQEGKDFVDSNWVGMGEIIT